MTSWNDSVYCGIRDAFFVFDSIEAGLTPRPFLAAHHGVGDREGDLNVTLLALADKTSDELLIGSGSPGGEFLCRDFS